jgi:hypothetical protein
MGLHIGYGHEGISSLLLMPDDLVHDHHMAEVSLSRGHEPAHDSKGPALQHGLQNRIVVAMAKYDLSFHIPMWAFDQGQDLIEAGYSELREEF